MRIGWVVFDLGETLIDETRYWRQWATRLGLPDFTWFGIVGGVIGRGLDHREAFWVGDPAFTLAEALERYEHDGALGPGERWWTTEDLYADAVPCLAQLRADGYRVGIAANNNEDDRDRLTLRLRELGVDSDLIATSAAWHVWKPDVRFFDRLVAETGEAPDRVVYVGDRVDNDILPARAAGLRPVFLKRGPWGYLQQSECPADVPVLVSLDRLPGLLETMAVGQRQGLRQPPRHDPVGARA